MASGIIIAIILLIISGLCFLINLAALIYFNTHDRENKRKYLKAFWPTLIISLVACLILTALIIWPIPA